MNMKSTPFTEANLLDAMNRQDFETDDELEGISGNAEIRTDYSGRGMFGDKCFAVVLHDHTNEAAIVTLIAAAVCFSDERVDGWDLVDSLEQFTAAMRSDTMGRYGNVYYWPNYELKESN